MFPPKLEHWLTQQKLPQRLLISGSGNLLDLSLNLAAQLLNEDLDRISQHIVQDVKVIADDNTSLKIGDSHAPDEKSVRGLVKWLYEKPVASHRVLILENLERTSREGLQVWLKVIEEPPQRAQFIFTSKNHYQLPETILSRVTPLIVSQAPEVSNLTSEAQNFIDQNDLIARYKIIENLDKNHKENPHDIIVFLDELLALFRQSEALHPHLPLMYQTYRDIKQNINRRLTLEHLALKLQNA
jgi:DNA polymerase III delta prime subunit